MQENNPFLEYVILIIVIIGALVFFLHLKNQDINLARYIFQGLVRGAYPVERCIDWENLKALDMDVGQTYRGLSQGKERVDYKREFIRKFSAGFKQTQGRTEAFTRWRIDESDGEKVVVAADYFRHNKTLLLALSKVGRSKLIWLQWR